jgi:hypothetical protein
MSRQMIVRELERLELEPRALGRSDYPTLLPLREVLTLAGHCAGGVILGFEQFQATAGNRKRGIKGQEEKITAPVLFPTPWNQLEAGVLFGLNLPLLVFHEKGVSGGIFDHGVTDVFIHRMPHARLPAAEKRALSAVFLKWQADVRAVYYGESL